MTCAACQSTIESHLKSLPGIVSCSVNLLTHKALISYRTRLIGIRTIIEEVESVGFGAKYEAHADKSDIRVIVSEAVRKYQIKFFISLFMVLPILVLIYISPYSNPDFVTAYRLNGVSLYVYLNAFFATII